MVGVCVENLAENLQSAPLKVILHLLGSLNLGKRFEEVICEGLSNMPTSTPVPRTKVLTLSLDAPLLSFDATLVTQTDEMQSQSQSQGTNAILF